jgi:hypothetical protein
LRRPRRFCVRVLRRRDLARSGPALERRLIALPWLNRAHHSGLGWIVHHSKIGRSTSGLGLGCAFHTARIIKRRNPADRASSAVHPKADCREGSMKGRVGARRVLPYVSALITWRARCEHRSTRRSPLPCYWAQRSSSHHMRRRCSQQHPPVLIRLFTEQRPCSKCGTYAGEGHMVIDAPISCSRMSGTCDPMPTGALNGITHIIPTTGVVA